MTAVKLGFKTERTLTFYPTRDLDWTSGTCWLICA